MAEVSGVNRDRVRPDNQKTFLCDPWWKSVLTLVWCVRRRSDRSERASERASMELPGASRLVSVLGSGMAVELVVIGTNEPVTLFSQELQDR